MRGLRDRTALVSGGSRGIGMAACQRFLEEGCRVFVGGHDAAEVETCVDQLANLGEIGGTALDVGDEASVHQFVTAGVDRLGGVDILINNAGIAERHQVLDLPVDVWDSTMRVNLRGMFLVARATARSMVARGTGGSIVNMSSTNAFDGEPHYAHYNASKAGVLMLTRTMASELGRHRIRVNALCPGYIDTPLNAGIVDDLDDTGFAQRYADEKIPLRRVGRPEEVAAAYAFLASDEAAFITGATLTIDGGQLASV
ncbi:SDR family NAD(P)-dependent oxidoreductase [Propionibacteriaceae bacterium Y2011]